MEGPMDLNTRAAAVETILFAMGDSVEIRDLAGFAEKVTNKW